jgi:hypothetical protein
MIYFTTTGTFSLLREHLLRFRLASHPFRDELTYVLRLEPPVELYYPIRIVVHVMLDEVLIVDTDRIPAEVETAFNNSPALDDSAARAYISLNIRLFYR